MPSELMESHGLSFLSEEVEHPNEKRIGFMKTDGVPDNYGVKDGKVYAVGDSSVVEKQMSSDSRQMLNHFDVYRSQDHRVHISLENNAVGAGSHSLRRGVDNSDKGNRSNLNNNNNNNIIAGTRFNAMGDHYENGLFSSSLSDLFSRKLRLSSGNSGMYGHSVGAAGSQSQSQSQSQYEEEEPFESLEEIEAQTIGNLLPDDDDLLSGVTDGVEYCKVQADDVEELDFFSSVGGMELGEDGGGQPPQSQSQSHGENPPSRTLFVRNINSNVEDSELRILFEQYGEIRTLYTACKHRGFVMISYYDIRAARRAMQALQNKPLRRRKLDIHYSIPKDNPSDKDVNQGTVVIYNLDSGISNDEVRHIFGVYGEVKEIHQGSRHKSIEFYDIRAAEAAFRELNKGDIGMNFKRPYGELDVDETSALLQMCSPPTEISGAGSHVTPGSMSMDLLSADLQHGIIPSAGGCGGGLNQLKYDFRNYRHPHPHSLPEYQDTFLCNSPTTINCRQQQQQQFNSRIVRSLELNNDTAVFGSSASASGGYMWNPSPSPSPSPSHNNMMWPNSTSLMNAHALPRVPSHHMAPNAFLHINNHHHHHHHVGSAPSVNHSIWDRRHSYAAAGESPAAAADASVFHHPSSLGNMNFLSHTMFPHMGMADLPLPLPLPLPIPSKTMFPPPTRGGGGGGGGQMIPVNVMGGSFDSSSSRMRRNEATSTQPDSKKQFELDLDRIMRGEDRRTTLMIKNIPNKYTSKMLLAAIDERHRGTYDFIYLPIDFKNKCNVGYAFINMTEPSLIVPFYQAFNGKKWEKFNSEKVASLAYARIQGKAALIAHFQNSSLMNEDKRCRPILFHTDGPNAGDQVPFPMGVNVRSRVNNKNRNSTNNDDVGNGEASSNGDSSSGSTKDFEC